MSSEQLVSIVIPAYNAGRYIAETLQSCLDQTHPHLEIIVVDDGSSDNTHAIVEDFTDNTRALVEDFTNNTRAIVEDFTDNTHAIAGAFPQVHYIHQSNAGPAAARNNGLRHATGTFLQFLDADDILLPTKIARSLEVFAAHPDTGLVYTNYEFRSEDLKNRVEDATKTVKVVPQDQVLNTLINTGTTLFGIHCALLRTDLARTVGGFDEDIIITEDWHFWVKLAAIGTIFRHVDETLVWYRTAPGSLSKQDIRLSRMRLKAYEHLRGVDLPPHINLEQKIAARHHALAMVLWRHNQRQEARDQFRLAIQTHPHIRSLRRVLSLLTYILPADIAENIVNGLLAKVPHK